MWLYNINTLNEGRFSAGWWVVYCFKGIVWVFWCMHVCMRYLALVSVLPAVDDRQLPAGAEKQHAMLAGSSALYHLNCTSSKQDDGHLLQVSHWLGTSTSNNPTSKGPNYHFKVDSILVPDPLSSPTEGPVCSDWSALTAGFHISAVGRVLVTTAVLSNTCG